MITEDTNRSGIHMSKWSKVSSILIQLAYFGLLAYIVYEFFRGETQEGVSTSAIILMALATVVPLVVFSLSMAAIRITTLRYADNRLSKKSLMRWHVGIMGADSLFAAVGFIIAVVIHSVALAFFLGLWLALSLFMFFRLRAISHALSTEE